MTRYLNEQDYISKTIKRPLQLQAALLDFGPNLLLLGERLEDTTGTQLLQALRRHTNLPCIVVSGASDAMDRIINLEVGSDDEIDRSISQRELLEWVRAVLQ